MRRRARPNGSCSAYWVVSSCGWRSGEYTKQVIASEIAATLRPLYPDRRFNVTSSPPE